MLSADLAAALGSKLTRAASCTIDCYAGYSFLKRVQQGSLGLPDQERDSFAALWQGFPEAVVRSDQKGRIPNWVLAAGVCDVSVAEPNSH
ncbi:hypothetical protein C1J03_06825 [Sulfitobacter sp. SK012]|uniref:hypothetical protein n=1 Tax=Sulfitobacter sp. SK012 TaxID=1389005 RepID=UPI000E0A9B21|nr:hypothetical protein [Sulfitobacter sp. SK012]AXI45769.1 hypothetical protein C1J03_06825 [Sulfitobacter sp. SK012]